MNVQREERLYERLTELILIEVRFKYYLQKKEDTKEYVRYPKGIIGKYCKYYVASKLQSVNMPTSEKIITN